VGKEQGAEKRRKKLMKQIIIYFALSAMLFALCSSADAQQTGKISASVSLMEALLLVWRAT
jgi:ABC-type transport system involved in cytochrome c biogenesis permease component